MPSEVLANLTHVGTQGPFNASKPVGVARIQFDLSDQYPTGGYLTFLTSVRTAIGDTGITVLAVFQASPCGGYKLWYGRATNVLFVYQGAGAAPDAQVADHTNLGAITGCEMIVIYE
jgi:hypothetical protein